MPGSYHACAAIQPGDLLQTSTALTKRRYQPLVLTKYMYCKYKYYRAHAARYTVLSLRRGTLRFIGCVGDVGTNVGTNHGHCLGARCASLTGSSTNYFQTTVRTLVPTLVTLSYWQRMSVTTDVGTYSSNAPTCHSVLVLCGKLQYAVVTDMATLVTNLS